LLKIIKTGSRVSQFQTGDIVSAFPLVPCAATKKNNCEYCNIEKFNLCNDYDYYGSRRDGSFCEILDVNEWNLFKITKNKNSIKNKSLIEPTAVSFNIIETLKNKIDLRSKILILGGGYIGQITARIIRNFFKKTKIHVLDRNKFKLDISRKETTSQILFSKNKNSNKLISKKLESKFDIVIETTGNDQNFLNSLRFVKKNGNVVFSGNINKNLIISQSQVSNILRKQITIKGVWNSSFKSKINHWKQAENFISENKKIEELITHTVDFSDTASLLKKIFLMKTGKLKNDYLKGIIKN